MFPACELLSLQTESRFCVPRAGQLDRDKCKAWFKLKLWVKRCLADFWFTSMCAHRQIRSWRQRVAKAVICKRIEFTTEDVVVLESVFHLQMLGFLSSWLAWWQTGTLKLQKIPLIWNKARSTCRISVLPVSSSVSLLSSLKLLWEQEVSLHEISEAYYFLLLHHLNH